MITEVNVTMLVGLRFAFCCYGDSQAEERE